MSSGTLTGRMLAAALLLACLTAGPEVTATAGASTEVRIQGRFTMRAVVTTAVNVHGEHRGERLTRTWRIRPARCHLDVCQVLHLLRTRGHGRRLLLTLHRRPNGTYLGRGRFFVALSCRGRVHRHGARAPYTIRLRATATRTVGGIRFARRLRASYENRRRIDSTPCLLQPSHDAARYTGRLRGGLPSPPRAGFAPVAGGDGLVTFSDLTLPGSGPGRRVVAWHWNFGDPASGAADGSTLPAPAHAYSAPGTYLVTLTAIDHAGLRATVQQTVVVAPWAPASMRASQRSESRMVASTPERSSTSRPIARRAGSTTA